jgi:predicted metal-dependent hydrolase
LRTISSSVSSEGLFCGGGLVRALIVRRVASARSMRLAVDPRDGAVRLTLPPRGSERRGRAWAETQRDWIERALAALPAPRPIVPGATMPFRGREIVIDWRAAAPRTPRLEDDRLILGGPAEGVTRRVIGWAKREARVLLEAETRAVATRAGVTVGRVAIGDPRSRWGSCSAGGDIRYAWRLVLAPPFVLSSTVAHEVAHRLHMDHGPGFHAAERALLGGDPGPARAWLRMHGTALHWVGADVPG